LDEGVHVEVIWYNETLDQKHNLCCEVGTEYFG